MFTSSRGIVALAWCALASSLFFLSACRDSSAGAPLGASRVQSTSTTDAVLQTVQQTVPQAVRDARRIVSIGAAQTEIVYALERAERLVGVDATSRHPLEAAALPKVGFFRQISAEGVLSLRPDLVLASHEAGPPSAFAQLESAGVHVRRSAITDSLDGARARIRELGRLLERDARAEELVAQLDDDLRRASELTAHARTRPRVLFLYARGPGQLWVAGADSAVGELLAAAGAVNAVTTLHGFQALTPEAVIAAAPDVVLLPSHGLESVGGEAGVRALPGIAQLPRASELRIVSIDDLLLLNFGPRTGEAVLALTHALHPGIGELAQRADSER